MVGKTSRFKQNGGTLYCAIRCLKGKNDYKNALKNLDIYYKLKLKNINDIQKDKVYEIEQNLSLKKKDLTISNLKTRNELNNRIILQQNGSCLLLPEHSYWVVFPLQFLKRKKNLQSKAERLLVEMIN